MKLRKIAKTFVEGVKNFGRNGLLTLATVSVMTLSFFIMSATVIAGFAGTVALHVVEDQLNIGVYFNTDVSEERVLEVKSELEQYQEIARVEFVSKEEALDRLLETDGDNEDIRKALDEIGGNPLPHSIVIYAHAPEQYESINDTLASSVYAQDIDVINYDRNKEDIARLHALLSSIQKIGLAVGAAFLVISVLITYNAVRLTLYSQRREFEIMRLVGASNLYIKLPSIFEGMLYGLSAAAATLVLLAFSLRYLVLLAEEAAGGASITPAVLAYWWIPVIALPLVGMLLGALSSWFAIRKYLRT